MTENNALSDISGPLAPTVQTIGLIIACIMVAMVFITYVGNIYMAWKDPEKYDKLSGSSKMVGVALPQCAAVAFALVIFLKQTSDPIVLEGLSFKFSGAAGPVILWILVYLAMAYSCVLVSKK